MMRSRLAFAGATLLALALVGCNGDDSDDNRALPGQNVPAAEESTFEESTPESTYLMLLDVNDVYYSSDAAAVTVAETICDGMENGGNIVVLGFSIINGGNYSAADAGVILGAAVNTYCPEYQDTADAQFAAVN